MLSDDVYRSKIDAALVGIRHAVDELRDVAEIDARYDRSHFALALSPRMRGACPLELMVRGDQRYDLQIGSESYEDCDVVSFADFEALIRAVAAGRVVTRHYFSAAVGSLRSVETVVWFADGRDWRKRHRLAPEVGFDPSAIALVGADRVLERNLRAGADLEDGEDGILVKDRTFLPYRR